MIAVIFEVEPADGRREEYLGSRDGKLYCRRAPRRRVRRRPRASRPVDGDRAGQGGLETNDATWSLG